MKPGRPSISGLSVVKLGRKQYHAALYRFKYGQPKSTRRADYGTSRKQLGEAEYLRRYRDKRQANAAMSDCASGKLKS